MAQPVLTAGLDMDVRDLYVAMTVFEVLCVPVLDDGQVVGMVTMYDVLQAVSRDDPQYASVSPFTTDDLNCSRRGSC